VQIVPGSRCVIAAVHHPCFRRDIGKVIIVDKVYPDHGSVLAHNDEPIRYRVNRAGRRVVDHDPRCIQTYYSIDALRLLPFDSVI
jgi:hypothetical protein